VVSVRGNEWGSGYWLACCLEGKETLNISITDDENNHLPEGSMVVKGEYLTHDKNSRKKGGYVFTDYKSIPSV